VVEEGFEEDRDLFADQDLDHDYDYEPDYDIDLTDTGDDDDLFRRRTGKGDEREQ